MEKKFSKKTLAGITICGLVLLGGVSYGAYTQLQPNDTATQQEPLNPTALKKKENTLPKTKKKASQSSAIKEETEDTSLADFKSNAETNTFSERAKALTDLNNQINKEQATKQANDNKVVQINKPSDNQSEQNESKKPAPNPVPQPTPTPTPDPTPTPNPPVIVVDYTALATLVQQAEGLNLSLYLSSSIEQFRIELLVSQRLLEELSSTQTAVDNQVARLQGAMNQLVLKGDKNNLQALYTHCSSVLTDIYTPETVATFEQAKANAKTILDNSEVSQETVDSALSTLQQALDGLKEKEEPELSLAYLQRKVNEAESIDTGQFTDSTAQVLTDKLLEAKTYITSGTITKAENERLATELQQAIDQLVKKADTTKLTALLDTINALDRSQYTDESLQTLDSVVAQVTIQLSNENLTQAEADSLHAQLSTAFDQLQLKPTVEG